MYYEYLYEVSEGKYVNLLFEWSEIILVSFVLLAALSGAVITYGLTK